MRLQVLEIVQYYTVILPAFILAFFVPSLDTSVGPELPLPAQDIPVTILCQEPPQAQNQVSADCVVTWISHLAPPFPPR